MLVLGVTVPVATYLSRRFSVRQHVFIGLAFFLVGAVLDLLAPNFGVMLAGRVCQAMSTGMLMPLLQTIAMTGFPPGRQDVYKRQSLNGCPAWDPSRRSA